MKEKTSKFELVLQVRDAQGNVTGRTKSFVADDGPNLEKHFINNTVSGAKKKKKAIAPAKTTKEIEYGLKETETHIEKIRKARRLED